MKKVVLIGASGFVGSAILNEALNRGFHVTAVVRHPEKIKIENENLKVVKADVSALDVADDVHALGVRVVDGLLERHRTVGAEQLVIRSLRLYGRNNVAQCVDQAAVEGYDALSGST